MRERVGLAEKAIRNEGVKELSKRLDTVGEHLKLMMKGIQKTTSCLKGAQYQTATKFTVFWSSLR